MENKKNEDWQLSELRLTYMGYGDNKGKYEGQVTFKNGEKDMFSFKLYPEMCNKYLKVVSDDLVRTANELGTLLARSIEEKTKE